MIHFIEGFIMSALVGGLALLIVARILREALRTFMGL